MIRGQRRVIKTPNNLDVKASIHNRFDIEVVDAVTGKVKQTAQALNVICDNLWTRLFTPTTYFNYIFYGGGTGTPSASDNSLFSHIGYGQMTNVTYGIDYATGVYYRKGSIQLAAATAAGETLSEVGIAYGTGTTNLCTHAMLKDMNGNPISIEKTDLDVVNIYATVYVHFNPLGYDNKSIFLVDRNLDRNGYDNQPVDLFAWASGAYKDTLPNIAYWSQGDSLGFVDSYYSQQEIPYPYTAYVSVTRTLSAADKTAKFNFGRLEASNGNFDQGLLLASLGAGIPTDANFHFRYHVPCLLVYSGGSSFPCSEVLGEAVGTGDGVTTDFALDFAFPHDVKVYVDGVETTDFTVDYAPNSINWRDYVKAVRAVSRDGNPIPNPHKWDKLGYRTLIMYNPMWEIGIETITVTYGAMSTILVSDDNVSWESITLTRTGDNSNGYVHTIPEEYRHKKFWKFNSGISASSTLKSITPPSTFTGKCLHLGTPPAEGAVITADYKCDCFAKDANHVLDMSVTIQFNEYTEAQ